MLFTINYLLLALLFLSFGFYFADMSRSQLLHLSYWLPDYWYSPYNKSNTTMLSNIIYPKLL